MNPDRASRIRNDISNGVLTHKLTHKLASDVAEQAEVALHLSGRTRPQVQPKVSQRQKRFGAGSGPLAAKALKVKLKWPFAREKRSSAKYNQAQIISHYVFFFFIPPPFQSFLSIFNWIQCIHQIQLYAGKLLEHKASALTVINPANSPTTPDRQEEEEGKPGTFSLAFTSGYFTHH